MPTETVAGASAVSTAELDRLLTLRPGPAADLVRAALGVPNCDQSHEGLPHGEAAVIGDTLTSATAFVSIGTTGARAALIAVGIARVLVVVPGGTGGVEVAALDARTRVGDATEAIVERVADDAVVLLAVPGGEISELAAGDDLAERVEAALP